MKPVSERYRVQELLFRVALLRKEVNVWAREKRREGKLEGPERMRTASVWAVK